MATILVGYDTETAAVGEALSLFTESPHFDHYTKALDPETCVEALDRAIGLLSEGVNGRDVHRAVCRVLVDRGFGTATDGFAGDPAAPRMIHSTGHGVGLEVHEAPALRDLDCTLQDGDVVTVEPGLYLIGLGGVRVEDTGMVVAGGFRDFTSLPRSLDPAAYL